MAKKSTLILALALLLFAGTKAFGAESAFRSKFINYYKSNQFNFQVDLVKKNKDMIPVEVASLLDEAAAALESSDKLYLLDVANAMATMYKHWHNDETLLARVEALQKIELKKEQERLAEIEKWKRYEKFLGNILIKNKDAAMKEKGVAPVIFPHWMHRLWFECRVCHQDIVVMKRGGNDFSHENFAKGQLCGTCHNGEVSFKADEECVKCHMAGKPEAEALYDVKRINNEKVKAIAERIGSEWKPENLPAGKMPLDQFGYIDWLTLKAREVFKPVSSLKPGKEKETRDNLIFFKSSMQGIGNIVFDHRTHTEWIQCSSCHPSPFKDELGANKLSMQEMASGSACGKCHSKVSFPFADCKKCHNPKLEEAPKGALIHEYKGL